MAGVRVYGLALQVGSDVLVPRPETELLVDVVRDLCASMNVKPQVQYQGLELGVGSGAVLCALQHIEPGWSWFGVDICEQAVAIAQANLVHHGGSMDQIWVSDWFKQVSADRLFDIIISNPPYLTDLELQKGQKALHFEPAGALASGPGGDEAYQSIIAAAGGFLRPHGYLVFEHADWQVATLESLAQAFGYAYVGTQRDLNGHQRISVLQSNKNIGLSMMAEKMVLATSNQGKIDEFRLLLDFPGWQWVPQGEYQVEDAEETGTTFKANALLKARHAQSQVGLAALADDSGLEVEALGGAPGIFSARYSGVHGDNQANINKLISELKGCGIVRSPARYVCSLAWVSQDGQQHIVVEDYLEGEVITEARGQAGFGYDPVFFLPNEGKTVAELEYVYKQSISHRARAIKQMYARLQARADTDMP